MNILPSEFEKQASQTQSDLLNSAYSAMPFYVHQLSTDQQFGPLSDEELVQHLQSGNFTYDDLGWQEGMAEWQPLRNLFETPAADPPAASPPAPETGRPAAAAPGEIPPLLTHKIYLVKERTAMLKLTDTFDILDPQSQAQIGIAKEEISGVLQALRLLVKKQLLPSTVNIYAAEDAPPVITLHKAFFVARIDVIDHSRNKLGYLKAKFFSLGGGFWIHNPQGQRIAEVKGDWKGWNFKLLDTNGNELGVVTKKWGGLGRELLTSADQYIISINENAATDWTTNTLLLAAGIAIDTIFKEAH